METSRGTEGRFERGDADRFAGEVWYRTTVEAPDGTAVWLLHFSPGARTHWHRHPGGQFLVGLAGRGRVRSRDEDGHILQAGDVVYVSSDEWHFHGADLDAPMVHVAVNGGGPAEWGEPVDDAEFGERF